MKGKFYFNNKDELLVVALEAWPEAERLPLKEAFAMKMLSYEELKKVERRLTIQHA